jgi:hypothetical protein
MCGVTRVPSGTDGVASATGAYHAVASKNAPATMFTRFGGFQNQFPDGGYSTSIQIYLDPSYCTGSDKRMDWSSAINNINGAHKRDFIFHVGCDSSNGYNGAFAVSASNNALGWPNNPGRNPETGIMVSGWYTLEHVFTNNGGVLSVDLNLYNPTDQLMSTWTLSDATDLIDSVVGGNRYGWIINNNIMFDKIPIDNIGKTLVKVGADKEACKQNGWMTLFRSEADTVGFKNQGDCIQFMNTGK